MDASQSIIVDLQTDDSGNLTGVIQIGETYYDITGAVAIPPMDGKATLLVADGDQTRAILHRYQSLESLTEWTHLDSIRLLLIKATIQCTTSQTKADHWKTIALQYRLDESAQGEFKYYTVLKAFDEAWREIEAILDDPADYLGSHMTSSSS